MSDRKLFADRTTVRDRLKRRPRVGTIRGFEHYGSLPLPYIAKDRDPGNHSFRKQRLCVRKPLVLHVRLQDWHDRRVPRRSDGHARN